MGNEKKKQIESNSKVFGLSSWKPAGEEDLEFSLAQSEFEIDPRRLSDPRGHPPRQSISQHLIDKQFAFVRTMRFFLSM